MNSTSVPRKGNTQILKIKELHSRDAAFAYSHGAGFSCLTANFCLSERMVDEMH